jgi:predicted  nucleic acid-binding Zn-ribbon protein
VPTASGATVDGIPAPLRRFRSSARGSQPPPPRRTLHLTKEKRLPMSVTASVLREIHRILRQLSDLRSRLLRGPRTIQVSETAIQQVDAALVALKEETLRTRMSADQKELLLKQRESRIVDARAKLNAASSNREYQTLVEQIAADEQANSVLSDEILELLEKHSELVAQNKEMQEHRKKADVDLGAIRKRVDEERVVIEADIERLTKDLNAVEAGLPGDFLENYRRLVRGRSEEALAPLDGECCGGCYTTITTQVLNELRMHKPVQCKSCGCILYLPEGMEN